MLFPKFLKTKGKGQGTWYAHQKTYLENKNATSFIECTETDNSCSIKAINSKHYAEKK